MNQLMQDIQARARVTPSLPAIRFDGQMLTYGELGGAIMSFEPVVARHGMSRESAFFAAVMHSMPRLAEIADPDEQGRVFDQIVAWLSRHMPPSTARLQATG